MSGFHSKVAFNWDDKNTLLRYMLTYLRRKLNCVRITTTSLSPVSKWPHAPCRMEKFCHTLHNSVFSLWESCSLSHIFLCYHTWHLLFLYWWCKYDSSQWELLLLWLCGKFSEHVSSHASHFKRCSWGIFTSNRLLFSPTLWDIWDPPSACCAVLCSALLCLQRALSQTAASLIYMGTWRTNLKPGLMYANHVNCYNILLPKLTSFHLVAGFTWCLLNESRDYVKHWASHFWCSTTFSFADMFNSLLDIIIRSLFGHAFY